MQSGLRITNTGNSKHRELKTVWEQVSTATLPGGCWISVRGYILEESFIWKKENANFWWSQQTYFIWITLFTTTLLPPSFPEAALPVFVGCRSRLHSNTVNSWTLDKVLSTQEVLTGLSLRAEEKDSVKSWPHGEKSSLHTSVNLAGMG